MAWNTKGSRGGALEEMVNVTNRYYRKSGLALVQKIPTPIQVSRMDRERGKITLAYFGEKSTVDYLGVVQGIPICFDAKECASTTFPLSNIHEHQIQFMKEYEEQGGISFLLLYFTKEGKAFYLPYRDLMHFKKREEEGGRKSFLMEELDQTFHIPVERGAILPYLRCLQLDLLSRDAFREEAETPDLTK